METDQSPKELLNGKATNVIISCLFGKRHKLTAKIL